MPNQLREQPGTWRKTSKGNDSEKKSRSLSFVLKDRGARRLPPDGMFYAKSRQSMYVANTAPTIDSFFIF